MMQAERMRSLGWAEYMNVEMTNNRQTMVVHYWVRKPPPPNQKRPPQQKPLPTVGGKLSISIVQVKEKTGRRAMRSPRARVLAELQARSKLEGTVPSDEVESMRFEVRWEPEAGALGVTPAAEDMFMLPDQLQIVRRPVPIRGNPLVKLGRELTGMDRVLLQDPEELDLERLLRKVIRRHTEGVMKFFQAQLQRGISTRGVFSRPGEVSFVSNGENSSGFFSFSCKSGSSGLVEGAPSLRVHLCTDEVVIVTVDPRTGRLTLRDTGDLAAAGRGPRFAAITQRLHDSPSMLPHALVLLRNAVSKK